MSCFSIHASVLYYSVFFLVIGKGHSTLPDLFSIRWLLY
ncbi:hypothetical protein M128_4116 [Bacteroides fragilis str. S6L8]|nr:hypothetical protein M074_3954 [Bacteroides fragilis str. DS-166]EYA03084.1 hypothetical protein M126_4115 [Bacteroides fragilis str. S6L3]EYA07589.1 hypothetical protein M130_4106 [Bacteroides fragilis str. S6R6]EYA98607.1 hypothetical protein M128_4116 [Bacteroides fragilis str. S6L8]EYB03208.1 hypothetical protein M129_4128 [Bacteroides fragilis str. S6R5]EYE43768.1 hypothetical protein M127_4007 [Bacteroides fragilis str. S6L5]EYE49739.1 hypothetical protein M131_3976 [Bacteroides frag